MSRKINVYFALTEYHLMCSVAIINYKFSGNDYENKIYFTGRGNKLDINTNVYNNMSIEVINDKDILNISKRIENKNINRLFIFQENEIIFQYICHKLKKKGATICLGPDGLKPYAKYNKKHELLSAFKDTIKDNYKLLKNNICPSTIICSFYYRYGYSKIINEIWLQHPDIFDTDTNKTKAKVVRFLNFTNQDIDILKTIFNYKDSEFKDVSNVIFYVNQPYWEDNLVEAEINMLKNVKNKFDNMKIVIKVHPLTPRETLNKYMLFNNTIMINDNIPAELYMSTLKDSILITGWSTSLIYSVPTNRYYYLFDYYKKLNDKILNQISINRFEHIRYVSSIDEII